MAKLIDETGNVYGYLTVIKRVENKGTRAQWLCRCKCGKEVVVVGKELRNGNTKSCGCYRKELVTKRNLEKGGDLIGQRFGKLVVLEFGGWTINSNNKRDRMWKCKCDCGNICTVHHKYLTNGDTSSCGCAHSKGNATITRLLNQTHHKYISEYSDKRFVSSSGGRFYYDFALLDDQEKLLCLIEYQGSIHFYAEGNGWNTQEALIKRQLKDKEKKLLCEKYNINLYYITYKDNIEEKLGEILNECYK